MSDITVNETPEMPVAPPRNGLMGVLARRRDQIIDEQILTLEVPRWTEPKLKIEFAPVDHAVLKRGSLAQERAQKEDVKKRTEAEINTNADILVNACIRIIAVMPDGSEIGLGANGDFTRFDIDAAIALGMPESSNARSVCIAFFITTADLLLTAKMLGEWSGYREGAVEEAITGE